MNEIIVLNPEGRLDSNNAESFEQSIIQELGSDGQCVIIDLSRLDYISSAGLRVILMVAKKIKAKSGSFVLCGLKPHIHEVFKISGFLPILTIVDNLITAKETI